MSRIQFNSDGNDTIINFDDLINKSHELLDVLESVNKSSKTITFLTVDDMIEITGFSRKTVLNLFQDPDFPSCDFGKAQVVELNAAIIYFSVPRKREYSRYWRNLAS